MLILLIILLLLFGGGGGYYGYTTWGPGGGIGIVAEIKGGDMYYTMFNPNVIYHKKLKDVRWNERNWHRHHRLCRSDRRRRRLPLE